MRKWVILDYKNGNKTIMEQAEYEKEMREEYGIDATAEGYYDEALKGIVEAEHEPTWDNLVYDKETETYYLKEF